MEVANISSIRSLQETAPKVVPSLAWQDLHQLEIDTRMSSTYYCEESLGHKHIRDEYLESEMTLNLSCLDKPSH